MWRAADNYRNQWLGRHLHRQHDDCKLFHECADDYPANSGNLARAYTARFCGAYTAGVHGADTPNFPHTRDMLGLSGEYACAGNNWHSHVQRLDRNKRHKRRQQRLVRNPDADPR